MTRPTGERQDTLDLTDGAWAADFLCGRSSQHGLASAASPSSGLETTGLVLVAGELAFDLLGDDPRRWCHTQAVAARAEQAAPIVPAEHVPALRAAAWLHDNGYAHSLRDTGFHPLDGARYLSELGWAPLVAGLVAQHSAARYVADMLGLHEQLRHYDDPLSQCGPLADALTYLRRPDHQPHRPD